MTTVMGNCSLPMRTGVSNDTQARSSGVAHSVEHICSVCCCGLLNQTLTVTFMVCLAFAIVVGNMVTLIVFMQTRQSHTPQGYLKVSLAIADMAVGLLVVPFSVYTEISIMVNNNPPEWYQGGSTFSAGDLYSFWQPCMLIGPVFAGCTFVSISTIFLMALERSVAILWPLHKDTLVTRHRTLILIITCWTCSFLLALAPLILSKSFTLKYNECSRMCNYVPLIIDPKPFAKSNIMLLFPAFDFTLLGCTLVVNTLSFTSICQNTRKRRLLSEGGVKFEASASSWSRTPSFSDIKAAKTIGILTFAFTASFLPIAIFVLGSVVGYKWCNFSFFAFWTLTGNSCCNVIIYSIRDQRFKKCVTLLFQKDCSPPPSEKG